MYIKEIELQNFKSFWKRVKIPFFDDFTTISGPNGSGKSNIIDAILFALGLSTSKMLRAEKLTDLIYNGNKRKNPDFAEVTIRFDNTDREIPINEDEISVTRKIQRTDKGYYSYFYFNNKACSLTDIHTYLSKAKISSEGYNTIIQGDVTAIIEMGPVERRKIVDDVAGVAEFDAKKERSHEELETVRERIERVDIILDEVNARLAQLQEERGQALKYQTLRDDRRRCEAFILLAKLKSVEDEFKKVIQKLGVRNRKKDGLVQEMIRIRGEIMGFEGKLCVLNEQITLKGEDEQIRIKREIESIRGDIARNMQAVEFSQNEINDVEGQRRRAFVEIDKTKNKIEQLIAQHTEEGIRKGGMLAEIGELNSALSVAQIRIEEVDMKFADTRDQLTKLKEGMERKKSEKNELLRTKDRLLDAIRRKSSEEGEVKREIENAKERISESEIEMRQVHGEIKELEKKVGKMSEDISDLDGKKSALTRELSDIEKKLWDIQQEYAKAEVRVKVADEIGGRTYSVEVILKAKKRRELSGIYGVIAELGKVDEKYATALEVAAGSRMQCIIADNEEDAACAIEFLKRKNVGRATFLPLNKMRHGSVRRNLAKGEGVIDYAINLVDYDKKFDSAFWHVFRDALVVEDLNTARKLMGNRTAIRMVTLDGELVEKSGAMTGGSRGNSRFKFAALEKEGIKRLAEQVTTHESRRQHIIDQIDAIDGQIASTARGTTDIDVELAGKKRKLVELEEWSDLYGEQIEASEKRLKELVDEGKKLGAEMNSLEGGSSEISGEIDEIEKEIEGLEGLLKESEIPALTEEVERVKAEIRRSEDRVRDIDARINTINMEKNFTSTKRDDVGERLNELEERKKQLKDKIKEYQEQITIFEEGLEEKIRREQELEVELVDMRKVRDGLLKEMARVEVEKNDIQNNLGRVEIRIEVLVAMKDDLQAQIDEINREVEACDIQVAEDVPPHEELLENIVTLKTRMEEMEPVNMRAIEEYDQVQERGDNLQTKRDILFKERNEIIDRIQRYEQMKKDTFMENFLAINAHFKEIFARLSEGEGELVLENWDDPFAGGLSIKAKPAGKAIRRMESMSGGEKSLTALTFIFAIQKHRPAPFYAFDEIDMFLDGANAERVASMIKNASKNAQFIVVSLRESMVRSADRTIGVTMQEDNISSVTGVRLN